MFSKCLIFLAAKGFFLKLISTNLLSGSIWFFLFFLLFSKVLLHRNVIPALSTPPFVVYHVLYQLFFFILLQVNFTFYSIWKDREQGRSSQHTSAAQPQVHVVLKVGNKYAQSSIKLLFHLGRWRRLDNFLRCYYYCLSPAEFFFSFFHHLCNKYSFPTASGTVKRKERDCKKRTE